MLSAVVALLAASLFVFAGPAAATGTGRVLASPCLNLRQGPNGSTALIGCIPYNNTISIDCTANGNSVTGPYGATTLWDHTSYNGQTGFVSDAYVYTGSAGAVAGACGSTPAPPPASSGRATGAKTNRNLGVAGQCTFGAYEQWRAATGYYPYWTGNAKDWAGTARANGWTVVPGSQARSIVVFQPGVQGADRTYGHVGWVTSVQQRSDGRYVTFVEMNGTAGPSRYDTRTVKDVVGMSYILAP